MAVDLKIVLGTVNYTDYLRVSAIKVSDVSATEVFVEYINTPVTNYTLIIPDLDPTNYYINFRDAPTTGDLGTLVSQAFVNAQTGEWLYERRFYRIDALPSGVTWDAGTRTLTDPYLENVSVTGIFKEAFRYLILDDEATHDDAAGAVVLDGIDLSGSEVIAVEIKYNVGTSSTVSAAGLFSATIQVTAATYSISSTDKFKRFALDCSGSKQEITLPALSGLATGDFVYLEHRRAGVQAQSRIKCAGSDKILFNGMGTGITELSEIWVSKGGGIYLRKEGTNWEVIGDYEGQRVGERMAAGYKDHVAWIPEDGRLMDGDEHPALYWFIRNVLPNTHYVTDNAVSGGGYTHPVGKEGLFVIHSSSKAFRMPNTQGLSERGLLDFDTYGADTGRVYDYPGGVQNGQVGEFTSTVSVPKGNSYSGNPNVLRFSNGSANPQNIDWEMTFNSGEENRVKNLGVIYCRHI